MRITLFTSSLAAGGAERSLTVLAGALADRSHAVTVVTWNAGVADFYSLPAGVKRRRVSLDDKTASIKWYHLGGQLRKVLAIRRTVTETNPDVVIGFLDGSNELLLLASIGKRFGKLLSCQNNPMMRGHYNRRWEVLRRYVYRLADGVVFLDAQLAEETQQRHPAWRCRGIPNPLGRVDEKPDKDAVRMISAMARFSRCVIAMGRLVPQKGFDLLLEAFATVARQTDDVGLVILGEGPLRGLLEAQRRSLGLENRVLLPGTTRTPHAVIARCDLFAFSSRYEGQGMALAEAMACGVAAVSFDCQFGPRSMIAPTNGGVLIPGGDIDAFAAAILELLEDEPRRRQYAHNARKISAQLAPQAIAARWEKLFESCR